MKRAKKEKSRPTFLPCSKYDGTKNYPLMVIKNAHKSHPSGRHCGQELGLEYYSNSTAWMTEHLFISLVEGFDNYIAHMEHRHSIVLIGYSQRREFYMSKQLLVILCCFTYRHI